VNAMPSSFQVSLGDALVLVNDEKTRSFLALRVEHGTPAFQQTLKCVDRCMALFQKARYYEVRLAPRALEKQKLIGDLLSARSAC